MPIHAPGSRLIRSVSLEAVADRAERTASRPRDVSLNLTSMIDCLVVIVVFLLMQFHVADDCCISKDIKVPSAGNTMDMIDAPLVAVARGHVLIDGTPAGTTLGIEEGGRTVRLDDLFNILKSKRELWKSINAGKTFPGVCILEIDKDIPAVVVKSIFQTATWAGYPNISFMVSQLPKTTRG